nr:putative reverse transcriptase domain-containing protein [Tanacetum cinerariifolium]
HSEARSWSILSEDPYEEAAQQLFEQASHSPDYVPKDHVPVFVPKFEHPEDLVPAEDEKDRATVRAEIEVLRSERLAYEQEGIQTREALARSEAYCRALEARVAVLETHARCLEQIMARTRRGQTPPPTNPNNMTPEAVQAMIDQTLLRNSDGRDGSHSSHAENPRNMHTARPCYYVDFMKCHPLNFKGTEGTVGFIRWIEKMESVFNISGDNNIPAYTNRFQELALICTKFVSNMTEKVDKYIIGLPDNIYGNVKSLKPKMLDETIELANDLMDQKIRTYAERKSDSKRKADDISRNNQQPFKRQNVAKAYNLGSAEKKNYEGYAPKNTGNTNATNNRGGNGPNPRGNGCFECGNLGHFKRDCPKLNNKNGGNGNAQGWVYVVGNVERNRNAAGNPDSNVVTVFRRAESYIRRESRLTVISCSKVQEYRAKGCHVFLAQISTTKEDDKPETKQVKDVPIFQDFPEVFLENFPGLPPARLVEFQIDLIPGAAPVARAPYRLAPSEMKELSENCRTFPKKVS